jgi:hypothetical protein
MGRGFAVVANEVKSLANYAESNSRQFRIELMGRVKQSLDAVENSFLSLESERHIDIARTVVQLIVRNLFERTADCRWWATESALVKACSEPNPTNIRYAAERLALINKYYSVYLNLILTDKNGTVLAVSNSEFSAMVGREITSSVWLKRSLETSSGDEYVSGSVSRCQLHNHKLMIPFGTAIRDRGQIRGDVIGALGVVFDWEPQARAIVKDEPSISDSDWQKSRVLILDRNLNIIAASNDREILEPFDLVMENPVKGFFKRKSGEVVSYHRTSGYEGYDGLGWYGVVCKMT